MFESFSKDDDYSDSFESNASDSECSQSSQINQDVVNVADLMQPKNDCIKPIPDEEFNGAILKVNNDLYKLHLENIIPEPEPHIIDRRIKSMRNAPSICATYTRYTVVSRAARSLGWKVVSFNNLWNILWTDSVQGVETYKDMKRFQKINHFPGMIEICRKDLLARNLNRMLKDFPTEYNIFPKTWCFPADLGDAISYSKKHKMKTYIIKPDTGAQGRGIWLTKNFKDFKPTERMICQVYITKPLLIDGYKFDLRVYTLITSIDPLRIFVFNEGLARFATTKYKEPSGSNTSDMYMHLTNYSVNKHSSSFIRDDEAGSKRKFSTLNRILLSKGHDVEKMWSNIDDIIIKTVISAWPVLKHNYHACFPCHDVTQACFEILGFDVLVDSKLKPYILEVNHSPSFHTDGKIDREVKESLVKDTFKLLNVSQAIKRRVLSEDKRRVKKRLFPKIRKRKTEKNDSLLENQSEDDAQNQFDSLAVQIDWEESHLGGFRRIMPAPNDPSKYKIFVISQNQASIFLDTAASKRREEAAKQLRLELIEKEKKKQLITVSKIIKRKPVTEFKVLGADRRTKENAAGKRKWLRGNFICESDERERAMLMSQRSFLVQNSGIFQQIFESFYHYHLLSESDRKKYKDLFEKLQSNTLANIKFTSRHGFVGEKDLSKSLDVFREKNLTVSTIARALRTYTHADMRTSACITSLQFLPR